MIAFARLLRSMFVLALLFAALAAAVLAGVGVADLALDVVPGYEAALVGSLIERVVATLAAAFASYSLSQLANSMLGPQAGDEAS